MLVFVLACVRGSAYQDARSLPEQVTIMAWVRLPVCTDNFCLTHYSAGHI